MFKKISKKLINLTQEFNETSLLLGSKIINKLDDRAQAEISAGSIIGLAIGLIVVAAVIPSAIETFYSYSTTTTVDNVTTGWVIDGVEDTKATTLWWLLPFISVAVVLYMIYKRLN